MCGLLIVKAKWPELLLPFFPTFWHLTLLYCIPFTSTVMFLLTQGSTEWLINVAITIMFLIVLVDWTTFLILTALGISLGFLFYTQVVGPVNIQLDFSSGYLLVYQGLFATLIGLLFARRKQQRAGLEIHQNGHRNGKADRGIDVLRNRPGFACAIEPHFKRFDPRS